MSETVVVSSETVAVVQVYDDEGTVVAVVGESVEIVEVATEGPQGVPGPQGEAGEQGPPGEIPVHLHTQSVPAATWIVAHNLNRGVHVTLRAPDGEYVEADVVASSTNVVTVMFPSPVAGSAVIS